MLISNVYFTFDFITELLEAFYGVYSMFFYYNNNSKECLILLFPFQVRP